MLSPKTAIKILKEKISIKSKKSTYDDALKKDICGKNGRLGIN